MNRRLFIYLLIPVIISFLSLCAFVSSVIQSSPIVQFNLSYENIPTLNFTMLNYTNSYKVNISVNSSNSTWSGIILQILNDTTSYADSGLSQNYSQGDSRTICTKIPLQILLWNGSSINSFDIDSATRNITLNHTHNECFPGRYYTSKLTVRNTTQTNENANLTVYLDIPISTSNTLNSQTGSGNFSGSMPYNGTTYYSYYFNATWTNVTNENLITNATGFVINLTSISGDVDVFVVDGSGTLKAKSINKSYYNESLMFSPLPATSQMWEIRVFGNSSTSAIPYNGNIIFTTLNSTNTSLNFGTLNSTTNLTTIYTLRNEGNLTINNTREVKELYNIKIFPNNTLGNTNYTFFVPDSTVASKVKISLNWTGGGNYSLNIYDSSGSLVGTSVNKNRFANVSKVEQEEYNESTNSASNSGYWTAEVLNNTNVTDIYNVTVYLYVNAPNWITTNFTSMSFDRIGNGNYSSSINLSLTVPSLSLNGTYGGSVKYLDVNNAGISMPVSFEVTTGTLLVNGSFSKDTTFPIFTLNESYGYNITRTLYLNISNTGFNTLTLNFTNSSNLTYYSGTYSGFAANFTHNGTNQTTISKNSFKIIQVNILYNSSMPVNSVYSGWIYVNSTNDDSNLTSHPYSGAYINLKLNLTNYVDVRVLNIKSEDWSDNVANASKSENMTIALDVYTINGTTKYTDLLISNFTGVWMQERNVSLRVPTTGNLSFEAHSSPIYCSGSCPGFGGIGHYYLNATIPANTTGGIYNVYVNTSGVVPYSSSGIGTNSTVPIIVNNSGLYMSSMNGTGTIQIPNSTTGRRIAINVTNYGPIAPSARGFTATIALAESCDYSLAGPYYVNCPSTSFNPTGYNSSCVVYWTVDAPASNYSACTAYVGVSPTNIWFNPYGVNFSIEITKTTSSGTTGTTGTTTTDNTVANLAFTSVPTLITVQQNSTNTTFVQVKNTGTKIQGVSFNILDLKSGWWTVNTTSPKILDINKLVNYSVTFSVGDAEVKDYNVAFKVNSSEKSITSNFTLRVTPAPAKQTEISNTFNDYVANLTKLGEEISKAKSEGFNVTNSTDKYNLAKAKIDSAQTYINNQDYFNANSLLPEIKTLLDDAWATLAKDKTGSKSISLGSFFSSGYIFYIVIGGAVAGIAILVYLFWPTKSPASGYGKTIELQPEKKQKTGITLSEKLKKGTSDKLEDTFRKLKEKWVSKKEKVEYKGS